MIFVNVLFLKISPSLAAMMSSSFLVLPLSLSSFLVFSILFLDPLSHFRLPSSALSLFLFSLYTLCLIILSTLLALTTAFANKSQVYLPLQIFVYGISQLYGPIGTSNSTTVKFTFPQSVFPLFSLLSCTKWKPGIYY